MSQKQRFNKKSRIGGLSNNPEENVNQYTTNTSGDILPQTPSISSTLETSQTNDMQTNIMNINNDEQNRNFNEMFSWLTTSKNFLIIVLFILLILSFLGVNILLILGGVVQWIVRIIGPFISTVLSYIGYTTGTIINKTSDVVADTAKTGIDIADGTMHSVGNLLKDDSNADVNVASRIKIDEISYDLLPSPTTLASSIPQTLPAPPLMTASIFQNPTLDSILNNGSKSTPPNPLPNMTISPVQRANHKGSWCLTGEYNGIRGCVEMDSNDVCMSGQIYPSQAQCLNIQPVKQEGLANRGDININMNKIAEDGAPIVHGKGPANYLSIKQF